MCLVIHPLKKSIKLHFHENRIFAVFLIFVCILGENVSPFISHFLIITEVELVCVYLLELSFSSSVTCLPIFFAAIVMRVFGSLGCELLQKVITISYLSRFPLLNTQLVLNECTHNCIIKALGITLHHSCHHYHHFHHHHYSCRFPRC